MATIALAFSSSVAAQEITMVLAPSTGTFYRDSGGTSSWKDRWVSDESPTLTIVNADESTTNNLSFNDDYDGFLFAEGSGASTFAFELQVEAGYIIKSMTVTVAPSTNTPTVTFGNELYTVDTAEGEETVELTDLNCSAIDITISSENINDVALLYNWTIVVERDETVSDRDLALAELFTIYAEYVNYVGYFTAGTDPGCYGAEEVAAFEAAMAAAADADGPDAESLTIEDLEAMGQAIIDAYEAVIASYISLAADIEEGYYFFNSGLQFYEEGEETEDPETGETIPAETIYVTKGMDYVLFTNKTMYASWETQDYSAPFLWKVTKAGDKLYDVRNAVSGATFNTVSTSSEVQLTVDSENLMQFDVGTGDSEGLYFIRVSTQEEGGMYYLHCGGHSSGAGVDGYIVGWSNSEPSSWSLQSVSEEEALALIEAYQPYVDSHMRYFDTYDIIDDVEPKMTKASEYYVFEVGTEELITSVDQLSSPYTEVTEGSLEGLIDGDASTYWHSDWSDGSVATGTHYLQVELNGTYDNLVYVMTRRSSNNDHITKFGIYGAPSADADKEDCTFLAETSSPYESYGETVTSQPFPTGGFTILRFYIDDTYYSGGSRGYGHMAEFQLYEATVEGVTQKDVMGDIYTNLEAAIAQAESEGTVITEETFATLQAAYDAFIAVYVDPTDLRDALDASKSLLAGIVIGTDPGFWSDTTASGLLQSTSTEAIQYDATGAFTQTQSDTYTETLLSQIDAVLDAAIKVQTGKWYQIRFGTEEEYEEYGWDTTNGSATGAYYPLFGKYVSVCELVEDEDMYVTDPIYDASDVCLGHNLYFEDRDEVVDDFAKFRFINVGDTAYMMQNKATGLFLKAAGTSGSVTISAHPTLFTVSAIGYGENVVSGWTLDGDTQSNLHGQRASNILVTWPASDPGTASGLYIEDIAEDVAADYDGTEFNMAIQYGKLNTFCYPVTITATEGTMYGVYVDGTTITLSPMEGNTAAAGQPFVFVLGDLSDYDAEDEDEPVAFIHGYDIEKVAQASGKLVGSYYGDEIGSGKLLASANEFAVTTSSATVGANSAYVNGSYDDDDVIVIETTDETFDGIETAIATVSQDGNIYSIDGKLLGKGNVNSLKALGKGIYIVNGVKVAVK